MEVLLVTMVMFVGMETVLVDVGISSPVATLAW
jgi:hypothetical protein